MRTEPRLRCYIWFDLVRFILNGRSIPYDRNALTCKCITLSYSEYLFTYTLRVYAIPYNVEIEMENRWQMTIYYRKSNWFCRFLGYVIMINVYMQSFVLFVEHAKNQFLIRSHFVATEKKMTHAFSEYLIMSMLECA